MPYKPTAVDIQWVKNMIGLVADGCTWGWPEKMAILVFEKTAKTLRVIDWGTADDSDKEATRETFKAVGWTVKDATKSK